MATIPDELLRDIVKHLDEWQAVTDEAEKERDVYVYAVRLTAKYDTPDTGEDQPK